MEVEKVAQILRLDFTNYSIYFNSFHFTSTKFFHRRLAVAQALQVSLALDLARFDLAGRPLCSKASTGNLDLR